MLWHKIKGRKGNIINNDNTNMNKETYEALKRVIKRLTDKPILRPRAEQDDIADIESWIQEVAKEYEE